MGRGEQGTTGCGRAGGEVMDGQNVLVDDEDDDALM